MFFICCLHLVVFASLCTVPSFLAPFDELVLCFITLFSYRTHLCGLLQYLLSIHPRALDSAYIICIFRAYQLLSKQHVLSHISPAVINLNLLTYLAGHLFIIFKHKFKVRVIFIIQCADLLPQNASSLLLVFITFSGKRKTAQTILVKRFLDGCGDRI